VSALKVTAWGGEHPLGQTANITVQPPRGLVITPHDPSLVAATAKAIDNSDIGARARIDGVRVRLELAPLTAEQRSSRARSAREVAEQARIAVRVARRDAINLLRRARAADEISEAKLNGRRRDVQQWVDDAVAQIDAALTLALNELNG
jgi:ribosome recycling factor